MTLSPTRPLFVLLCLATLTTASGCDPTSEQAFMRGRALDPCLQTIPACPGLFASCTLDSKRYTRVVFPGEFRFMVNAEAGHEIEINMYLAEQRGAGLETQIYWNEPGCSDVYAYSSEGRNLFQVAGEDALIIESQTVLESGEHLIEIFTDMQADVLISAETIIPGT